MNSLIGKETKEAMLIGAMLGHKFMIDGILKHLAHEIELSYNKKPVLVSTGGASSKYHSKNILQKNMLKELKMEENSRWPNANFFHSIL